MKSLMKNLIITAECLGQTLSENAALMMIGKLANYSAEQVNAALEDCLYTLSGRLTLAAIFERLQANDGHPTANEAWAIALQASSQPSVTVTYPIREALKLVRPLLDFGDKFGARAAFIERYQRLVKEARERQQFVDWQTLPKPQASETWQQNALPKPEINPEQARDNLARVRGMLSQALHRSEQQKNETEEKRRAQLREQAQHFAQLEQQARDLKREALAA